MPGSKPIKGYLPPGVGSYKTSLTVAHITPETTRNLGVITCLGIACDVGGCAALVGEPEYTEAVGGFGAFLNNAMKDQARISESYGLVDFIRGIWFYRRGLTALSDLWIGN